MSRVIRHELPLDHDGAHEIPWFPGNVLLVDSRHLETVELWVMEADPSVDALRRRFVVVGTGHPVPDGATHVGSTLSPDTTGPIRLRSGGVASLSRGELVWHVFELPVQRLPEVPLQGAQP